MKKKIFTGILAGLLGISSVALAENEATFDFGTGTLNIPTVKVYWSFYNWSLYSVDMQQQGQGLDFSVTGATASTSSSTENIAVYYSSTGGLMLPMVIVGSDSYNVYMTQQGDGYNFSVTTVELVSTMGRDTTTAVVTVTSAGQVWMDRNLGASQVATSSTDTAAYGVLYQWGRGSDGHQMLTSGLTATLSTTDNPGHRNFILSSNEPYDWRNPQNNDLWQGESGINNPCPVGFRLPTEAEWATERDSWASDDPVGAFGSPLKLVVGGFRYSGDSGHIYKGNKGFYWSSTIAGSVANSLTFINGEADMAYMYRANGLSVRCIQDVSGESEEVDCNGDVNGIAVYDACGNCVAGATGEIACVQDCEGTWGGVVVEDSCGVCGGDDSSCQNDTDSSLWPKKDEEMGW